MTTKKQIVKSSKETKREPVIIAAIIALIGTIITAVLSSPLIIKLLESPTPTVTGVPSIAPTVFVTNTPDTLHGQLIAFISKRDGNYDIYLMEQDGSKQTNLTHSAIDEMSYIWSPNGTHIAFVRSEQLIVLDINTMQETQVTKINVWDYTLEWSPDGKKILFISADNGIGIYTVNLDGTELIQITNNIIPDINIAPSWSPDSKKISFSAYPNTSDLDRKGKVYIVNADGSDLHSVVDLDNVYPVWSPDGRYLALSTIGFSGNEQDDFPLYIYDLVVENLTTISNKGSSPNWAFDSKKFVFDSLGTIYTNSPDGFNLLSVFSTGITFSQPSFSPDATEILFTCSGHSISIDQPYNTEVCKINTDGTKLTELTTSSAPDFAATWQP